MRMENVVHHGRIKMKKGKEILNSQLPTCAAERHVEILTGIILFAFGAYQSILYFGHAVVPISDFSTFFQVGKDVLHLRLPASFKYAPVVGLLQNLLVPVSWGQAPDLTAGWLLNAILHPFSVVLLWLVGITSGSAISREFCNRKEFSILEYCLLNTGGQI